MVQSAPKFLQKNRLKAFTLFEVMVALAILSIAMVASIVTTKNVLQNGIYIEKKILAHWVAMNVLNKAELKMLNNRLEVSTTDGMEVMRNQEFKWKLKIQKINFDNEELLRMQVSVFDKNDVNHELDSESRNITLLDTN